MLAGPNGAAHVNDSLFVKFINEITHYSGIPDPLTALSTTFGQFKKEPSGRQREEGSSNRQN